MTIDLQRSRRALACVAVLAVASCAPAPPAETAWTWATPAGFRAGRGGRILRVSELSGAGPGSLREAIEARGPRLVVFEVGGVVDLARANLTVREPFLTIAGQTAPDPGITLVRGGLRIETHDVLVQHLRVRPGEAGHAKQSGWEVDGITTSGPAARDILIDHCSISWATDENLSASGERFRGSAPAQWRRGTSRRITFSNNIVAEGLSRSTHAAGEHSKGTLVHDNVGDVAIVGNLYAHNAQRNPFFKGGASGVVVNNLIYGAGRKAVHYALRADEWGEHPFEIGGLTVLGNALLPAPDSAPDLPLVLIEGEGRLRLYLHDNLVDGGEPSAPVDDARALCERVSTPPSWPDGLRALRAADVLESVLAEAGARPWDRDQVDLRVVRQVRERVGRIIDGEDDVGGYPEPAATRRAFDEAAWAELLQPHELPRAQRPAGR